MLQKHLDSNTDFENFFANAPIIPMVSKISGVLCGIKGKEFWRQADATDSLSRLVGGSIGKGNEKNSEEVTKWK